MFIFKRQTANILKKTFKQIPNNLPVFHLADLAAVIRRLACGATGYAWIFPFGCLQFRFPTGIDAVHLRSELLIVRLQLFNFRLLLVDFQLELFFGHLKFAHLTVVLMEQIVWVELQETRHDFQVDRCRKRFARFRLRCCKRLSGAAFGARRNEVSWWFWFDSNVWRGHCCRSGTNAIGFVQTLQDVAVFRLSAICRGSFCRRLSDDPRSVVFVAICQR